MIITLRNEIESNVHHRKVQEIIAEFKSKFTRNRKLYFTSIL